MSRSSWKGPYVDEKLIKKVNIAKKKDASYEIKTWSRRSTIIPSFVGVTIKVHNGKGFVPVFVDDNKLGHLLGEFAPTRTFKGHSGDKKAKK